MTNKNHILTLVFFLIILAFHPAQAQELTPITNDLTELSLDELMNVTIVSAAKKEQKISHVAASAFVITDEDIKRYGYRTLGEALQRISGMYLSSDRNYDYLGVRGFSLPGDYNSRILVLVDGLRTNTILYDQAYIDATFPIDVESIKRIEVVKGPGSALWGSNALFAVINVITQKGNDLDGGRLMVETGSHARRKAYLEYGKIFAGGLNLSGSIAALGSDGENHIYFPELDQPGFNNGLAEGVDAEEAYKGYLTISYKDFGLLFNKSRRTKTVPPAAWDGAFNNPAGYTVDEVSNLEINHQKNIADGMNGRLFTRIYHNTFEYYGDYPYFADGGWLGSYIVNKDQGSSKQWGGEIRYGLDPRPELAVTIGLEYMKSCEIIQKNYDDAPNYSLALDTGDAGAYHTSAYYGQGEYSILDNLQLIAGLRVDDYSTFGEQLSPRIALLYSPRLATTLKLLYGKAFRAPNNFESFYEDGYAMTGNPSLQPEEIKTWELVFEHNFSNHTRLVASLFRFEVDDLISQVTIPALPDDLLQFQNLSGTVRSDGAEIQLESHLENGISGFLGLSLADTKELAQDSRLNNSPTFIITGGVSAPVYSEKLYISTNFQHLSRRTSPTVDVEAYTLVNLAITTGSLLGNIDLSFNIYNLFDQTVNVPGAGEHYHYDPNTDENILFNIPQDGRTFRMQLSYNF
ncbi:MAG TPA: TonB-dependent receptor [Deltaproteobacteria bacterium]|nr:TonB-dependent receptor [Deltaproteobacteria bacterium]